MHVVNTDLSLCVSAGTLGENSWPPAVDFYDFLKIMDTQEADSHTPEEEEEEEEVDEEEANMEEDLVVEEETDSSSSSPAPDNNPNTHSEL